MSREIIEFGAAPGATLSDDGSSLTFDGLVSSVVMSQRPLKKEYDYYWEFRCVNVDRLLVGIATEYWNDMPHHVRYGLGRDAASLCVQLKTGRVKTDGRYVTPRFASFRDGDDIGIGVCGASNRMSVYSRGRLLETIAVEIVDDKYHFSIAADEGSTDAETRVDFTAAVEYAPTLQDLCCEKLRNRNVALPPGLIYKHWLIRPRGMSP